jgi:hypothetical protein
MLVPAPVIEIAGTQGCHIAPGLSLNSYSLGQHAQLPCRSATALRTDLAFRFHSEPLQAHRHGTESGECLLNYIEAD